LKLRTAIEEFIDYELSEYNAAMARYSSSRLSTKRVPKKPSLLSDVLDADDWSIIARYVELLRPYKEATMLLQGHVSTATVRGTAIKGAI
jgi:hypothetical protein